MNVMPERLLSAISGILTSNTGNRVTREAPTVSPKSLLISGAKNEPSGHGEVLLLK